jgi:quinohemoprotein ethanol dehydrogenase
MNIETVALREPHTFGAFTTCKCSPRRIAVVATALGRIARAAKSASVPMSHGVLFAGCAGLMMTLTAYAATIVDGRAIGDAKTGSNWLSYGRTYSESYYSPLALINDKNVNKLGLAWFLDLPGERTLEATPLAVDGVLLFSGTYGKTYAVDARSGRLLWKFDPHSGEYRPDIFRYSGSLGGHRGVAYWRGKVYVGVIDGRLFALDVKTGQVLWNVQTFDDPKAHKAISGAPRVFNGKVIIGHNCFGSDSRGYVTAYDAETGEQRWRFFTVPGEPAKDFENPAMAMAAKTWSGQWWKSGGNGSVWDSIVYDPEFNRVYIGTADPGRLHETPKTDKLFVSSIVALNADTGEYLWHYQENPGGYWDYDSDAPMILADLTIGGIARKVLLHAPKNGFVYVIDRTQGQLISAEKFTKVTWADRIDLKSGRPVETPDVRDVWPSFVGAHSWQPMSFNPRTELIYIPTMKLGMHSYSFYDLLRADANDGTGSLLAWDPVAQKKRWEVRQDSLFNGGTMTTAGDLVFQGTGRGDFMAYDARTGESLWRFAAGLGILATPISYQVDGVQYISVLVGYGGTAGLLGQQFDYGWRFNEQPRRLLTFALGKRDTVPAIQPPRFVVRAVDDSSVLIDAPQVAKGADLYGSSRCGICHGPQLQNTGSFAPDLRESALAMNWEAFKSVLQDGSLAALGMPKFGDLSDEQLREIYMYVRQRARDAAQSPR